MNKIALAIKDNNYASNDPRALCGRRTEPSCGPELFLEGTWSLVCHKCGAKFAPGLVRLLDLARNAEEYYLAQWGTH